MSFQGKLLDLQHALAYLWLRVWVPRTSVSIILLGYLCVYTHAYVYTHAHIFFSPTLLKNLKGTRSDLILSVCIVDALNSTFQFILPSREEENMKLNDRTKNRTSVLKHRRS